MNPFSRIYYEPIMQERSRECSLLLLYLLRTDAFFLCPNLAFTGFFFLSFTHGWSRGFVIFRRKRVGQHMHEACGTWHGWRLDSLRRLLHIWLVLRAQGLVYTPLSFECFLLLAGAV